MKHLGDITKIDGSSAPKVCVVIGGSPCQDLSVAGKRSGLSGERSGLFMEMIRIIKEMREDDKRNGRTGSDVRPRFMVWENVPGAFSSNKGEDFRIVLEEIVKVVSDCAVIPRPPKNKWRNTGVIMGDGFSVAWRVLDAQFWGVPQRRRRIALVADFGGCAAPEILFERESLSGDSQESGRPWEGTAGGIEDGSAGAVTCYGLDHVLLSGGTTYQGRGYYDNVSGCLKTQPHGVMCLNDQGGSMMSVSEDITGTLRAQEHGHQPAICIQGNCIDRADTAGCNGKGWREDTCFTLTTVDRHAVFDARGNGDGDVVPTITGDHESRVTDYTAICLDVGLFSVGKNTSPPLLARAYKDPSIVCQHINVVAGFKSNAGAKAHGIAYEIDKSLALTAGQHDASVLSESVVRRLTPLECERLQGYPDGWTDIGEWTDTKGKVHKECADTARYKALGNSIALPPWRYVLLGVFRYCGHEKTMASLFDGIGGFPLIWRELGGNTVWASEIEEFPIAVTKKHFN